MRFVKPFNDRSRWILNQILPGRADFLMQKTPLDRMGAVASYLEQQIKVKIISQFEISFRHNFKKYSLKSLF